MKIDLSGKTAVIIGGSGGLGEAMAHMLTGAGAAVALVGRNQAKLDKVAHDLSAKGGKVAAFTADMTNEGDVHRLARDVNGKYPKPQILINSAGINIRKPVTEFTLKEWTSVVDSSLVTTFVACNAFVQGMKGSGYGPLMDIVLGIIGGVVGGWIMGMLGFGGGGLIWSIIVAIIGAIILVWVVRLITGNRTAV